MIVMMKGDYDDDYDDDGTYHMQIVRMVIVDHKHDKLDKAARQFMRQTNRFINIEIDK